MDTHKVIGKAVNQLSRHAKENYATERCKNSPPRRSLSGLLDAKALSATRGVTLPWVSAAKETYQSHMAFGGIETFGASSPGILTSRLEDDFLRESDYISAALVETGFAAILFGIEDSDEGKRIRLTSYSGKNSTVILNEWGDPEYGVIIVDQEDGVTTAEVHSATGWRTVKFRKDGDDSPTRIIDEGEFFEHGLGVCLFVPLVGKRIIEQEAVSILSDAILVYQMAFVSDALHTSPRELFKNVPMDATSNFRDAQLGSPLNGPLVLPRIPEKPKYPSAEAEEFRSLSENQEAYQSQAVEYERSFGADNSSSYAEQLKRAAFSFVQVVPMPESWAALTPGGLNGILGADELNKMSDRFFSTVSRMNRKTSRTVSRALNSLLEALGQGQSKVEVVFGERTAYELDKDISAETAFSHAGFLLANGVLDASTPEGVALLGKILSFNTETISAIQASKLRGRAQRLLDEATNMAERDDTTATQGPALLEEAVEPGVVEDERS